MGILSRDFLMLNLMSAKPTDVEQEIRTRRIRREVEQIDESVASLQQMLPTISDAEERRKIEQVIQSCRLYANRLNENLRAPLE
jgi:hypothetical protein